MQNFKIILFLLVLYLHLSSSQFTQIGCLLWENSFLKIENETNSPNNNVLIFSIYSRQYQGWVGVTITSQEHNFNNSISVIGYKPDNILQLKNHTELTSKTIFSEGFFNKDASSVDGVFSFTFRINVSEVVDKKFFYFAKTESPMPSRTLNSSNEIPIHYQFSKALYFDLKVENFIPVCHPQMNISGRLFSELPALFIAMSLIYIALGLVFLQYKDDQPFKSRFAGPFITLFALYFDLSLELYTTVVTVEDFSKVFCIQRILSYTCIQIWYYFKSTYFKVSLFLV
jgi:hypothetical protein